MSQVDQIQRVPVTPCLAFLYSSVIEVDTPIIVGQGPHGERRIVPIQGGRFSGPRLCGRVLPGGADWQIIRADGITEVEARYTIETDDGCLIYVCNRGLRHGPKEVMKKLASGENVNPSEYYFRTVPIFEASAGRYEWLNGIVAVAAGERRASEVYITVYQVS